MASNINANADNLNSQINDKPSNTKDKFNGGKSGVVDKKKKIFGKIAAAKEMSKGVKLKTNSDESVNNDNNSLKFLTDLIKSLIGYSALIEVVIDFLTNSITEIEELIKNSLKDELKTLVSCGINPTIPSFLSTQGIVIEVSKIDFLEMLKVDPTSEYGKLIYNDITTPLTNSTDFNTFLYGLIQDDGTQYTWDNMLDITFNSLGNTTRPNNSLTIKVNPLFSFGKLPDLNDKFIKKGPLLDTNKVVNKTIDTIYGTISSGVSKTLKQLEMEGKIDDVISRMIDANHKETIDDGYFTFTNDDIYKQQESALWKQKGILKLDCCNKVSASIPVSMLTDFNAEMTGATIYNKKEIVTNNINKMAEQNTVNSTNPVDDTAIKLDFIQKMLETLIKSISSSIISPKIVFIFLINLKIVYGQSQGYDDAIDFIKLSRNLFKTIIKKITKKLMQELIKVVLKYVGELTALMAVKRLVEKSNDRKSQLLSLVGVPQDVLRVIKGLM